MPAVNRVAAKKQALAGPMRITIEGKRSLPFDFPFSNIDDIYQDPLGACPVPSLVNFTNLVPRWRSQRLARSKCFPAEDELTPNICV